jgi:hypothetical protein
MKMSEHTPGPWLREGNTIYALMHHGWRKGVEQMRNRFTTFVQKDREISDKELEANARLICAAPELLEALKLCRPHMYDHASNTPDEAFNKLCAAIAKAEGTL